MDLVFYWEFVRRVFDVRLLGIAVAGFAVIVAWRWLAAWWWRTGLVAFRLRFPRGLDPEQVAACVGALAAASGRRPVAFEVTATADGIDHFLITPGVVAAERLRLLRSMLPGIRAVPVPLPNPQARRVRRVRQGGRGFGGFRVRAAAELALSSAIWPLAADRAPDAVAGVLAGLQPVYAGEALRMQVILRGAKSHAPPHPRRTDSDVQAAWVHKHDRGMADAVVRVAVTAEHGDRARHLLARVVSGLVVMNAPGAGLRRRLLPGALVASRANRRCLPISGPVSWPVYLNTGEAVGFLGWPLGDAQVPGLTVGTARQIAPHQNMPATRNPGQGTVIGYSNYPGMETRPLTIRTRDRVMHCYALGPPGSGKSTLLANMIGQDVTAGAGVFVIDPKDDLITDVLARIPDERTADVVVIDAANTRHPVGINLLQPATPGEHARDLIVDQAVSVMGDIWRASWGPRTSDVLRNALLTLTATAAPDGSAFTIAEVPELLTNDRFRAWVLDHAKTLPPQVRSFWSGYADMTTAARYDVIGPAMNKLRSLTTRTALRLVLGQSAGIDVADVFTKRRILLVNLAKGTIGAETANLLGALVFSRLWDATLARTRIPADRRRPVFGYLDEFQDVVRLASTDLADTLAQARGLGLGLTLAHQYLAQIPDTVRDAVMGTVRTTAVFAVDHADARDLAPRHAPGLDASDLSGADAYEVALSPCVNSQTLPPVTGRTLPLPDPVRDPRQLAQQAARRYGTPRRETERGLRARLNVQGPAATRRASDESGGGSLRTRREEQQQAGRDGGQDGTTRRRNQTPDTPAPGPMTGPTTEEE